MAIDFNQVVDRRNTWSLKWDYNEKIFGRKDILPMWVADMDFPSPDEVIHAIKKRADHGLFGYTEVAQTYNHAVIRWMEKRNHWSIREEWIAHTPGVVSSINIAILAFTGLGDKILIQSPVYHPFYSCVAHNDRQLVINPLKLQDGRYVIDYDDLESKLAEGVKMMIFCSPHNPVGRVWTKDELAAVAGLCIKYNVLMLSDEIHSDIVYEGFKHTPISTVSEDILHNSITCISPTKTFNLAGLAASMAIIPDKGLRVKFHRTMNRVGAGMLNLFGLAAAEAAYSHGEIWLNELIVYLQQNLDFLQQYFLRSIPDIKIINPEGTYLAWMDCRLLQLTEGSLKQFFVDKAGIGLNDGTMFGKDGAGFQRLNFACPRTVLQDGLQRIEQAVKMLK